MRVCACRLCVFVRGCVCVSVCVWLRVYLFVCQCVRASGCVCVGVRPSGSHLWGSLSIYLRYSVIKYSFTYWFHFSCSWLKGGFSRTGNGASVSYRTHACVYILYSFVARALWLCLHPCPRPCDDACTAPHHEVPAGSISRTTSPTPPWPRCRARS